MACFFLFFFWFVNCHVLISKIEIILKLWSHNTQVISSRNDFSWPLRYKKKGSYVGLVFTAGINPGIEFFKILAWKETFTKLSWVDTKITIYERVPMLWLTSDRNVNSVCLSSSTKWFYVSTTSRQSILKILTSTYRQLSNREKLIKQIGKIVLFI